MDIELRLREIMTVQEPGVQTTDAVMARVGGQADPEKLATGTSRLSDARARTRSRYILSGTFIAVAAAAGILVVQLGSEERKTPQAAAHPTVVAPSQELQPSQTPVARRSITEMGNSPAAATGTSTSTKPPSSQKRPRLLSDFSLHEASETMRAFGIIGLIAQIDDDSEDAKRKRLSIFQELGIYPADLSELTATVTQMRNEYWEVLERSSAARCTRGKDVVTFDMFSQFMREQKSEIVSWQVQRYRKFRKSLSLAETTPPEGVAVRPVTVVLDEWNPEMESFDFEQYYNFIKSRDDDCPKL